MARACTVQKAWSLIASLGTRVGHALLKCQLLHTVATKSYTIITRAQHETPFKQNINTTDPCWEN